MSRQFESFEKELEALQPAALSNALRERIGAQLHAAPRVRSFRYLRPALFVGGLAAAVLFIAVLWQLTPDPGVAKATGDVGPTIDDSAPTLVVEFADVPSVAVYQRAFADSPEALDFVLARHAAEFGGERLTYAVTLTRMPN